MSVIRTIRDFVRAHVIARLRMRYTRALEDEVARLRAENRALVNSVLGIAGIPPMRVAAATRSATATELAEASLESPGRGNPRLCEDVVETKRINIAVSENAAGTRQASSIAAVRRTARRSWQQIGRTLEIGDARAARLDRESDTETFPTPRNVVPRT